jgi:hypothetical protein
MNSHLARSAGVAWSKRGYQDRGTVIVRPSLKSTLRAASVTVTFVATGMLNSLAEVLIQRLQDLLPILSNNSLNSSHFHWPKAYASVKTKRFQPVLRRTVVAFHMNMGWFVSITGIEQEPTRSASQNSWHVRNFFSA